MHNQNIHMNHNYRILSAWMLSLWEVVILENNYWCHDTGSYNNLFFTITGDFTDMKMLSFWWHFHHWLHWKLSLRQFSVQPVTKMSSKWWHFHFSVWRLSKWQHSTFPLMIKQLICNISTSVRFKQVIKPRLKYVLPIGLWEVPPRKTMYRGRSLFVTWKESEKSLNEYMNKEKKCLFHLGLISMQSPFIQISLKFSDISVLDASEAVKMTTSSATSDGNFVKITFLFLCLGLIIIKINGCETFVSL